MRLRVRFFAIHREQLGRREEELDLPPGTTVATAWRQLVEAHPVLAGSEGIVRFARNGSYADPADPLADGDELAIIPPVAGGALRRWVRLTADPIESAQVAEAVDRVAGPADGAVVTFVGRTRQTPGTPAPGQEAVVERLDGERVVELEYEAYEAMAIGTIERIADEAAEHFGIDGVVVVHRTGVVPVGSASVAIAVSAPHRAAAFDGCRYMIDELKARAPIWKSERFASGRVWLGQPARAEAEPLSHASAAEER